MCRLYAHRASRPIHVADVLVSARNSLLAQSRSDRRGKAHRDGWGMGYYRDGGTVIVKQPTPADSSHEYHRMAAELAAQSVVAHVRQASVGELSQANTHPFSHGRWIFVHNGTIENFALIQHWLIEQIDYDLRHDIQGSTDSEHLFYYLLSQLRRGGIDSELPCSDLALASRIVAAAVRTIDAQSVATQPTDPSRLNLVLTDGQVLIATRFRRGLHWTESLPGELHRTVALASEPIDDRRWQLLDDEHLLAIDARLDVHISQI